MQRGTRIGQQACVYIYVCACVICYNKQLQWRHQNGCVRVFLFFFFFNLLFFKMVEEIVLYGISQHQSSFKPSVEKVTVLWSMLQAITAPSYKAPRTCKLPMALLGRKLQMGKAKGPTKGLRLKWVEGNKERKAWHAGLRGKASNGCKMCMHLIGISDIVTLFFLLFICR